MMFGGNLEAAKPGSRKDKYLKSQTPFSIGCTEYSAAEARDAPFRLSRLIKPLDSNAMLAEDLGR
jgi:hypothetical protein